MVEMEGRVCFPLRPVTAIPIQCSTASSNEAVTDVIDLADSITSAGISGALQSILAFGISNARRPGIGRPDHASVCSASGPASAVIKELVLGANSPSRFGANDNSLKKGNSTMANAIDLSLRPNVAAVALHPSRLLDVRTASNWVRLRDVGGLSTPFARVGRATTSNSARGRNRIQIGVGLSCHGGDHRENVELHFRWKDMSEECLGAADERKLCGKRYENLHVCMY
mmetsp:Transcript_40855/g.69834  ORF Transcript_40855/g.69834 Transcript_40855/m.69834 type:complete len:227 (+) Transcript_40855:315-995(+)